MHPSLVRVLSGTEDKKTMHYFILPTAMSNYREINVWIFARQLDLPLQYAETVTEYLTGTKIPRYQFWLKMLSMNVLSHSIPDSSGSHAHVEVDDKFRVVSFGSFSK